MNTLSFWLKLYLFKSFCFTFYFFCFVFFSPKLFVLHWGQLGPELHHCRNESKLKTYINIFFFFFCRLVRLALTDWSGRRENDLINHQPHIQYIKGTSREVSWNTVPFFFQIQILTFILNYQIKNDQITKHQFTVISSLLLVMLCWWHLEYIYCISC